MKNRLVNVFPEHSKKQCDTNTDVQVKKAKECTDNVKAVTDVVLDLLQAEIVGLQLPIFLESEHFSKYRSVMDVTDGIKIFRGNIIPSRINDSGNVRSAAAPSRQGFCMRIPSAKSHNFGRGMLVNCFWICLENLIDVF